MSEYKAVGGKLELKGGISLKPSKKKKSKKKKRKLIEKDDQADDEPFEVRKLKGSGRIISTGTTIMGKDGTKFVSEISVGDAMIIVHPTSLKEETRIVKMVLSDMSASIRSQEHTILYHSIGSVTYLLVIKSMDSSPFSTDLISTTSFYYIKAPKEEENEETVNDRKKKKKHDEEKLAFGTYAGGGTAGEALTYRVKKAGVYGGYKVVRETADENRTREDLLDMRSKKKGDRHCM